MGGADASRKVVQQTEEVRLVQILLTEECGSHEMVGDGQRFKFTTREGNADGQERDRVDVTVWEVEGV